MPPVANMTFRLGLFEDGGERAGERDEFARLPTSVDAGRKLDPLSGVSEEEEKGLMRSGRRMMG